MREEEKHFCVYLRRVILNGYFEPFLGAFYSSTDIH